MREITYLSLYCHHQNDSCIKAGSEESHFNVSLTVRDKVKSQCPRTTTFEVKGDYRHQEVTTRLTLAVTMSQHSLLLISRGPDIL